MRGIGGDAERAGVPIMAREDEATLAGRLG